MFAFLPDVSWPVLAAVPLILVAGYVMFGATGFGSSIIAVPLLAHAFPLTFAVPLVTALDSLATINAAVRQWRQAVWPEFLRILPAMLAGIGLGATVLVNLPRAPALLALGLFVGLYGLYILAGPRSMTVAPGWLAIPIGLAGGIVSVLFGSGGPIYIVYLSARIRDKSALRATSSVLVTVSVWLRVGVFIGTGLLLQPSLLALAAAMVPVMLVGFAIGSRLHERLSRSGVLRLIAGLLVINGSLLVVRAVGMLGAG